MAIINLTWDNVDGIVCQVHEIFNQERNTLLAEALGVTEALDAGDEVYSWLLPRENNKKILEAMPDWHKPKTKHIYIKVNAQRNEENEDSAYVPILKLSLKEDWYRLGNAWPSITIPFAKWTSWDTDVLVLYLKDTDKVPQGPAGDLVKKLFTIAQKHNELTEKIEQAVTTMREFLGQHRTLQTALKECPAIMSYVPDWMKQELKRVPPKRTRRPPIPKAEKKEIDMSQLVTQATIAKLNL